MRTAGLAILYEGEGRPLTVARVADRHLLVAAAEAAIREAEERAEGIGAVDDVLGAVEHEDVRRLRRVLGILLPEMSRPSVTEPRLQPVAAISGATSS